MTNEERVDEFKKGKIAINCYTQEEANKFVKWCHNNDIYWPDNIANERSLFEHYESNTCYVFEEGFLAYGYARHFRSHNYPIINYREFFVNELEKTNLELAIENFENIQGPGEELIFCEVAYKQKNDEMCSGICEECEFESTLDVLKYFSKKHENKINVSKVEYDILKSFNKINKNTDVIDVFIYSIPLIKTMKEKGYFKNVPNLRLCQVMDLLEIEDE